MAGGPPTYGIGAETDALGIVVQSAFGTPPSTPPYIPANGLNWIEWVDNSLKYNPGRRLVESSSGNRATLRKSSRGPAMSNGGFSCWLQGLQNVLPIAAFFGTDTIGTISGGVYPHVFDPLAGPKCVALEANRRGQSYLFADCFLDTMTLSVRNGSWLIAFTVVGGDGSTEIASSSFTALGDAVLLETGDVSTSGTYLILPGSLTAGEVDDLTLTFSNNVKQFRGFSSYHPTKAARGNWAVTGSLRLAFDSQAAKDAYHNQIAGTESALKIGIGSNPVPQHVISLPSTTLSTDSTFAEALDSPTTLTLALSVRNAEAVRWTASNTAAVAYV